MNKYMLKFTLTLLSYLGAITEIGDGIEDDIINDLDGKAKILENYTPPNPDDDENDDPGEVDGDNDDENDDPGEVDGDNDDDPKDDLGKINKTFGTEFKTVDELIASDIPAKYKDLPVLTKSISDKDNEIKALRQQLDEVSSQVDPLSYFANEQEFVRQQLLKKHPEYDPSALAKIVNTDIEKADPVTIIKLQRLLKDGDIYRNESEVMESIKDEFDYDPDTKLDDQDFKIRNKILRAAKEARIEFKTLQQEVQMPDKGVAATERQQKIDALASSWTPFVSKDLLESLKKIEFKAKDGSTEFEFNVDDMFLKNLADASKEVSKDLAKRGVQFTPDAQKAVIEGYMNYYKSRNIVRIAKAYAKEIVSKMDQAQFEAIHNTRKKKIDTSHKPGEKDRLKASKEKAEAEIMKDLPR